MSSAASGELAAIAARLRAAGCVFAEDEARLLAREAGSAARLETMVSRRAAGFPLEHVLGRAEFCGLQIAVSEGVFVPRRRSEFLVREAVRAAGAQQRSGGPARAVVVDLCCGSGAVGIAVAAGLQAAGLPAADLHAADLDPAAVACARANLAGSGHVYQGDLYQALPARLRGQVSLLVVNAPYVPTAEIAFLPGEARLHEPALALDGGADGVEIHRRVAAGAARWLGPRGNLLIETSARQAAATAAAMSGAGLTVTLTGDDELAATVVTGTAAAPAGAAGG